MAKYCEIPCELCPYYKFACPELKADDREQIRMDHHDGLYKMPEE